MAVIGALDATPKQKEAGEWALLHGACLLWTFVQPKTIYEIDPDAAIYNKPISMLKGPGEVPKGTFNKLN